MNSEELDKQLHRARRIAEAKLRDEPRALEAKLEASTRQLVLTLATGPTLRFDADDLQGLAGAPVKALARLELTPSGRGIHWPELDADLSVPHLVRGTYGTRRWMQAIGSRGGQSCSEQKQHASRINGRQGGRPRNVADAAPGKKAASIRLEGQPERGYRAVVVASNGRILLTSCTTKHKADARKQVQRLRELVNKQRARFAKAATPEGFVITVCDEHGSTLAQSRSYRNSTSASRALGMLPRAIKEAQLSVELRNPAA